MKRFTPENITELKPNEVFVFGSNLAGSHAGGAARVAYEKFGAVWGQGEGRQGQSYAIPTLDESMRRMSTQRLRSYVLRFLIHASGNKDSVFYLTKIGLGIAGYTLEEMREVFRGVGIPANVVIPKEFEF